LRLVNIYDPRKAYVHENHVMSRFGLSAESILQAKECFQLEFMNTRPLNHLVVEGILKNKDYMLDLVAYVTSFESKFEVVSIYVSPMLKSLAKDKTILREDLDLRFTKYRDMLSKFVPKFDMVISSVDFDKTGLEITAWQMQK
jgi:hypothetical protein